jgi:hypothetical protein
MFVFASQNENIPSSKIAAILPLFNTILEIENNNSV